MQHSAVYSQDYILGKATSATFPNTAFILLDTILVACHGSLLILMSSALIRCCVGFPLGVTGVDLFCYSGEVRHIVWESDVYALKGVRTYRMTFLRKCNEISGKIHNIKLYFCIKESCLCLSSKTTSKRVEICDVRLSQYQNSKLTSFNTWQKCFRCLYTVLVEKVTEHTLTHL